MNGRDEDVPADARSVPVPSPDAAALQQMYAYRSQALPRARAKAAGWIPGITAMAGVLTAATVIGVANDADAVTGTLLLAGLLALAGAGVTLYGIGSVYSAANADSLESEVKTFLAKKQWFGAADHWDGAVDRAAQAANTNLRKAVIATSLGALIAAAATFLAWMPQTSSDTSAGVCVRTDADVVVKLGEVLPVSSDQEVTLTPCPD
jgi:hypothetical protein